MSPATQHSHNRISAPSEPPDPRAERAKRRSEGLTTAGRPLAEELQAQHRSTPEQNKAARTRILEAMGAEHMDQKREFGTHHPFNPRFALSTYAETYTRGFCKIFELCYEKSVGERQRDVSLQMLSLVEAFPGWRSRDRRWGEEYPDFATRVAKLRELINTWIAEKRWMEIELMYEKMLKARDEFEARGLEWILPAEEAPEEP